MNTKLVWYLLGYGCLFAILSLILGLAIDTFSCDKLTEENYTNSRYYKDTGNSFVQAVKDCTSLSNSMSYMQLIMLPMGIGVGYSAYRLSQKNKPQVS